MVVELGNLGDKKTVILHTNDNRVYRKLLALVKPLKVVRYEQGRRGGRIKGIKVTFSSKEKIKEIYEVLPKLNCRFCGFGNCGRFAEAIVRIIPKYGQYLGQVENPKVRGGDET